MAKQADDKPTVRAVVAYARELRSRAQTARDKDPVAPELYAPSDDAARKVSQSMCALHGKEDGPALALQELAKRAFIKESEHAQHERVASAGRQAWRGYQAVAEGERIAERATLTLGRRLDHALRGLALVSEVSAVRFDSEPVSTGKSSGGGLVLSRDPGLDHKRRDLLADAERVVERLEREHARSTRRLEDAA